MRNTIPSKCVLLQIIIYSCAIVLTLLCGKRQIASLSCLDKTVNDLDYRQISLLSVSCRSIICLILRLRQILIQFTDKSRYFAQTCKAIKKYFLAIVYALNKSVNIAWAMFSLPPWSVCYCSHKRKSVCELPAPCSWLRTRLSLFWKWELKNTKRTVFKLKSFTTCTLLPPQWTFCSYWVLLCFVLP